MGFEMRKIFTNFHTKQEISNEEIHNNPDFSEKLIVPVYINEKVVLDLLAIVEDGFSMVSQVTKINKSDSDYNTSINGALSSNAILDKLLKIEIRGEHALSKGLNQTDQRKFEKIHTNVSLLSRLRSILIERKLLISPQKSDCRLSDVKEGAFLEVEGSLS